MWHAWSDGDVSRALQLDARVLAGRESAELQEEERHLGSALRRLTDDTEERRDPVVPEDADMGYVSAYALAAVRAGLSLGFTLVSFGYAWSEHQTSAATRLIPLGQTDGQRVLQGCLRILPGVIDGARAVSDEDIGSASPGLAIASALHETLYTRLFRS
jgi:urease accessory protein